MNILNNRLCGRAIISFIGKVLEYGPYILPKSGLWEMAVMETFKM